MLNKSILIIDTPKNCDECDFCRSLEVSNNFICMANSSIINNVQNKQEDCPLRPLPRKQVANEYDFENYSNGIIIGWNRCWEAFTGENSNYAKYNNRKENS